MINNNQNQSNQIKGFRDLKIYQNLYQAMIVVHKKIIPNLPKEEKFVLCSQMSRASKGAPALIAEGFAKRFQKKNWEKYLNDCIGECNEMIHHLSICIDLYPQYIDVQLCKNVIDIYDVSCKQTTNLKKNWQDFHRDDR